MPDAVITSSDTFGLYDNIAILGTDSLKCTVEITGPVLARSVLTFNGLKKSIGNKVIKSMITLTAGNKLLLAVGVIILKIFQCIAFL